MPRKREVVIGISSKRPIKLKNPTSYASRRRRRTTMSMVEVLSLSRMKDEVPEDFMASFSAGSTAQYTWGVPATQPVLAVANLRRHKGFGAFGFRRGKRSAFEKFFYGDDAHDSKDPFRLMDLPLEIRWRIYSCLLIKDRPILVHSDWHTVHSIVRQDHAILRVSKQILLEGTQFLYERNVFHAVVAPKAAESPDDRFIKKEYLSYLKNVIIECEPESKYLRYRDYSMINATAKCIGRLVQSETLLDSLTLIISPKEGAVASPLTVSHTTLHVRGFKSIVAPVESFLDYFEAPASKIMRVIPKLCCKFLNIILRLPERKPILVSIDLTSLPVNNKEIGWFARDRVAKRARREMVEHAKAELVGLKTILEEIHKDCGKAIMEGKARVLGDNELYGDGKRLALRGRNYASTDVAGVP